MIHFVDKTLEQFLRRETPLPERAADISFEPPDKTWGAGITRPTLNAFLWDVSRAQSRSSAGMQQRVSPDTGGVERRQATPIVALHYLVTAWATELRDEHQLLGTVLECVLANPSVPADLIPENLAGGTWSLSLATDDRRLPNEFWSALGGSLKPGLQVQVTLPVEVFAWKATAAEAEQVSLTVVGKDHGSAGERDSGAGTGAGAGGDGDRDTVRAAGRDSRAGGLAQSGTTQSGTTQGHPALEEQAAFTRRRVNGALVMEGRGARPQEADPA